MLEDTIFSILSIEYPYLARQSVVKLLCEGYRASGLTRARIKDIFEELELDTNGGRGYVKLLAKYGLKHCSKCGEAKEFPEFRKNKSRRDGLQGLCKVCQLEANKPTSVARSAKYKAAKLQAIPVWACLTTIAKIYAECPENLVVDHIIPLQGRGVCGLHVEYNLQYLTRLENSKKYNKF